MIIDIYQQSFPIIHVDANYTLREQSTNDAEDFFRYYSSNPMVTRYILATVPPTLKDAISEIEYCRNLFYHKRGIYWSLARRDNNQLIGAVGLYINNHHHRAELCYDLSEEYWGQGIMSKAVTKVLDFAFSKIDMQRIEALTMPENETSMSLLRKVGFEYEGKLRNYRYFKSKSFDVQMFGVTAQLLAHKRQAQTDVAPFELAAV